jgi:hypothetical protein
MIYILRKKPVEVEAIQLLNTPQSILEVTEFIQNKEVGNKGVVASDRWHDYLSIVDKAGGIKLKTLESDGETQIASFGDFIIKGVKGEFYPCKPDIVSLTYDILTK